MIYDVTITLESKWHSPGSLDVMMESYVLYITIPAATYYVFIAWEVLLVQKMEINFRKFSDTAVSWENLEFINWFPTI